MFFRKVLFFLFLLSFPLSLFAQSLNSSDLSKIKVDNLTDQQVQQIKKKVESSGMTEQQLEVMARSRGMSDTELQKLKARMGGASSSVKDTLSTKVGKQSSISDDVFDFRDIKEKALKDKQKSDTTAILSKRIFGYYLFNSNNLTFEPSDNMPTPRNYQLSAGDQLSISIWGASQSDYSLTVSPEGQINIPLVGPVFVSGLTIEHASELIKTRLRKIYAGLGSNTYALINLTKIRSIKVNIVGEARVPGSYNLSSLSSVFNALYVCGGPNDNGSFRNIKVMRDNRQVADIDVYNYLLKGDQSGNVKLHDQDVILISEYKTRVEVTGEVKRPLIYEMRAKETLSDVLNYAGGYTQKAYTNRLKVFRNTTREKQIFDVSGDSLKTFVLNNGDSIVVEPILNRFENLVEISGAVYREGKFSLQNGLTLKGLIEKAEGLRGDAYLQRALIYRTKENFKIEAIQVNLEDLMKGSVTDIPLVKDDQIHIFSLFDLQEKYQVSIFGEVGKPGDYPFAESMTLEDVIAQAGGFLESASSARIEIARRIKDENADTKSSAQSQLFIFNVNKDLKFTDNKGAFILQPFDQIFVRKSPAYEAQKTISISGEVNFPGTYALSDKVEKLSDLIKRAGGLTSFAYTKGAKLQRRYDIKSLEDVIRKANGISDSLVDISTDKFQSIGIDLEKIMTKPGSKYDIILQPDDKIIVPKELQTVGVNGAILYSIKVKYDSDNSFRDYIAQSGGFATDAMKGNCFVIYANGSVGKTKHVLFFRSYPHIEPGAEIVVPREPEKAKMTPQETLTIATAISSLALIIVTIVSKL
jgi:protein involved in polysaccharide export with SLBB domain